MNSNSNFRSKNIPFYLIFVFVAFSIGIIITGYYFYKHELDSTKAEISDHLKDIVEIKSSQIVNRRKDLIRDAENTILNPLTAHFIQRFFLGLSNKEERKRIITWIRKLEILYDEYMHIYFLNTAGNIELASNGKVTSISKYMKERIKEIQFKKKVVLTDFYRNDSTGYAHLDLIIPVDCTNNKDTNLIGIVLVELNPYVKFYDLIQSWPTKSRTAEVSLFRLEGEEIVYLNELRHRKNTALTLKHLISTNRLFQSILSRDYESVVEGIDYRGENVLAVIKSIPNSPWFIMAKMDSKEIFQPLKNTLGNVLFVVIILISLAGSIVLVLWRNQRVQYYLNLYKQELENEVLLQRFEILTKYANDIIILSDHERNIIEVNEKAIQTYGYSKDEFVKLKIDDIRVPVSISEFNEALKQIELGKGRSYESMHRKKDGKVFPVEVSARMAEIENVKYLQAIIRDITSRKEGEELLRKSEKKYRQVVENLNEGIWVIDKDLKTTFINHRMEEMLGYSEDEIIGRHFFDFLDDNSVNIFKSEEEELKKGIKKTTDVEFFKMDGTRIFTHVEAAAIFDDSGSFNGAIAGIMDITKRKLAEEALKTSEERYRNLSAHLESIREEERTRIAREIHDELGQALTGLKIDLICMENEIKEKNIDNPELLKKIDSASSLIDSTTLSVRKIITELRPGILDLLGLNAAMEWYSNDFQERTGIKCNFKIHAENLVVDQVKITPLFRVFQEALTNVVRHSKATNVNANLEEVDENIILKIQDNGIGITQETIRNPKSFGILGMRERINNLDGKFDIYGSANEGTTILIKVPKLKR